MTAYFFPDGVLDKDTTGQMNDIGRYLAFAPHRSDNEYHLFYLFKKHVNALLKINILLHINFKLQILLFFLTMAHSEGTHSHQSYFC